MIGHIDLVKLVIRRTLSDSPSRLTTVTGHYKRREECRQAYVCSKHAISQYVTSVGLTCQACAGTPALQIRAAGHSCNAAYQNEVSRGRVVTDIQLQNQSQAFRSMFGTPTHACLTTCTLRQMTECSSRRHLNVVAHR